MNPISTAVRQPVTVGVGVLLVVLAATTTGLRAQWSGSGTTEDPFRIATAADLHALGADADHTEIYRTVSRNDGV